MNCQNCGHPALAGSPSCARCGAPLSQVSVPAEPATSRRPTAPVPVPEPLVTPPPPPQPYLPGTGPAAPPEVWLVALGLLAVGGLLLYPVVRYGGPLFGHLFDGNDFVRAFTALFFFVFVLLGGAGAGLVALAVGLIRGSRVAQLLTCLVAGILALTELVQSQSDARDAFGSPGLSRGSAIAVAAVCAAIVVLIAALPGARRFFAADADRPFGVLIASVVGAYFGACIALDGLLLMVCGAVGKKFVWWGIGFALAGAALMASNRALRAGRQVARVIVSLAFVGCIVLLFVVNGTGKGDQASFATLVSLGLALAALGALWLPASSQVHFATQVPLRRVSAVAGVGWVVFAGASVALAGVGFAASPPPYEAASQTYDVPTVEPTYAAPSETYAPQLTGADAQSAVTSALDALDSSGTAPTDCVGSEVGPTSIQQYTIGDVSPQTDGSFIVSATVTLNDGSTEVVQYLVGTDNSGSACIESADESAPTPATPAEPSDVPGVPAAGDPVPTDVALPAPPQGSSVLAYDDPNTPTTADEIVEWQPDGLDADQAAAVRSVIAFMTYINQQDFQNAWNHSTELMSGPTPSATFARGYATSRFYQVAFGQPDTLAPDLIVIPGRFVSRQDPSQQGNPEGVTDCTYWPQYVFVAVHWHGWRIDVAGVAASRPELTPLKRVGSDGGTYLNPRNQRVDC